MFKPNRIGTPHFWNDNYVEESTFAAAAFGAGPLIEADSEYNVTIVNGSPYGDYGGQTTHWMGTPGTIAANEYKAIGMQFTITEPLEGNVAGTEVHLGFGMAIEGRVNILPFFGLITGDPVIADFTNAIVFNPHWLDNNKQPNLNTMFFETNRTVQSVIVHSPANQVILGQYVIGYILANSSENTAAFNHFKLDAHIRQLNDQADLLIGYRDTLK